MKDTLLNRIKVGLRWNWRWNVFRIEIIDKTLDLLDMALAGLIAILGLIFALPWAILWWAIIGPIWIACFGKNKWRIVAKLEPILRANSRKV